MEFAKWALSQMRLTHGAMVVDPWNGSGTTAAACAQTGISCRGYDLNPVMVHLARARIGSDDDFEEAFALISAIEDETSKSKRLSLVEVGRLFKEIPVGSETANSIAISALFPLARRLMKGDLTKNPSWYRKGSSMGDAPLQINELMEEWRRLTSELAIWKGSTDARSGFSVTVERGDSRRSLARGEAFDGLLTSPPYLTRLDYVQATLPELMLVQEFDTIPNMRRLRRSMLGSPLTTSRPAEVVKRLPDSLQRLLKAIQTHPSKASNTYYHRFFSTYLVDLQASMRNIVGTLKPGAVGCMVLQPSQYKEIKIDLPDIAVALGEQLGFSHLCTKEFEARRSMSSVNSRAHADARIPKSEYAVFFKKRSL